MSRPLLSFTAILLAVGCADNPYVPVSGRVTLNGKPVAEAMVRFQPTGGTLNNPSVGRGSYGKTDADGRFSLQIDPKLSGAAIGKQHVTISKEIGRSETLPAQFNSQSDLTFEVPAGGADDANFDLIAP